MTEPEPFDALETLAWTAWEMRGASMTGRAAPIVQALYKWSSTYKVGDLVMEQSTHYSCKDHKQAIGIVEKIEDRTVCIHEHEDPNLERCTKKKCTADERWREHYTWLRTSLGRHRWYNAGFFRIPRSRADHDEINALCQAGMDSGEFRWRT